MSELQTRFIDDTYVEYQNTGKHDLAQVYLKTEVDQYIAELEESHKMEVEQLLMEIVKLKADYKEACGRLQTANLIKDEQLAATRHHKYKRCLAMADRCRLEQERIELIENQDITDDDFDKLVKGFWQRWHKRWLELAKKFKEA